jgi:hypothetical protein
MANGKEQACKHSTLNSQPATFRNHVSRFTFHGSKVHMKILPPADANERRRVKECLENQLRSTPGGPWRVYIVPGRYGWYARAEQVRSRRKQQSLPDRKALLVSDPRRRLPCGVTRIGQSNTPGLMES